MGQGTIIGTAKTFSFIAWLKKYKFWVILIVLLLPGLITSIKVALQEHNWTYPFFLLGAKIISADNLLDRNVNLLMTNPAALIGMAHPDVGIWLHFVYYWKVFFNVIVEFISDMYLIFLPLVLIHKVVTWNDNSRALPNILKSVAIFLGYLFVINAVVLVHGLIHGNSFVTIPHGLNLFYEYLLIFLYLLPFHGIYMLGKYIVLLVAGMA